MTGSRGSREPLAQGATLLPLQPLLDRRARKHASNDGSSKSKRRGKRGNSRPRKRERGKTVLEETFEQKNTRGKGDRRTQQEQRVRRQELEEPTARTERRGREEEEKRKEPFFLSCFPLYTCASRLIASRAHTRTHSQTETEADTSSPTFLLSSRCVSV